MQQFRGPDEYVARKEDNTMRVKEMMTAPVVTCAVDHHLNDVARCMWEYDCGSIPIVDDDGRLVGMLTDRDVCMAAYTQGLPLEDIRVPTAMSTQILLCHIDDSVEMAERLMREGQVRRVPVVDNNGRPVGIISMNDLARVAGTAKRPNLDRDVVRTLAAVSEPRFYMEREHTTSA